MAQYPLLRRLSRALLGFTAIALIGCGDSATLRVNAGPVAGTSSGVAPDGAATDVGETQSRAALPGDAQLGDSRAGPIANPGDGANAGGLITEEEREEAPDSSDLTDDTACSGVNLETEPVEVEVETEVEVEVERLTPVAMYVVLDNSGSMGRTDGGAVTKWQQAVEAMTTFVSDDASAGLDVALKYFNEPGSG